MAMLAAASKDICALAAPRQSSTFSYLDFAAVVHAELLAAEHELSCRDASYIGL